MAIYVRNRRPLARKTRKSKRRVAGKRSYRKSRIGRSLNSNRMDRATVIEVQELTATPEGGDFINHSLSQFSRALAVSKSYRFYRCKKVELEFIPYANVFAPGTAFPELYFQVDRTQGRINGQTVIPTKGIMMSRGVLPQRWTSIVKKYFKPSVLRNENMYVADVHDSGGLQLTAEVQPVTSTPVFNKWYMTSSYAHAPNPDGVMVQVGPAWDSTMLQYYGASYFIDQPLAPAGAILGTIKIKVHWEFKQPLVIVDPSPPPCAKPIK